MHTADSTRERDLDFCRAMTVWASVLLALGRAEGLAFGPTLAQHGRGLNLV